MFVDRPARGRLRAAPRPASEVSLNPCMMVRAADRRMKAGFEVFAAKMRVKDGEYNACLTEMMRACIHVARKNKIFFACVVV